MNHHAITTMLVSAHTDDMARQATENRRAALVKRPLRVHLAAMLRMLGAMLTAWPGDDARIPYRWTYLR